jgi:hypothetical protein
MPSHTSSHTGRMFRLMLFYQYIILVMNPVRTRLAYPVTFAQHGARRLEHVDNLNLILEIHRRADSSLSMFPSEWEIVVDKRRDDKVPLVGTIRSPDACDRTSEVLTSYPRSNANTSRQ